jgi:hypothetical protein
MSTENEKIVARQFPQVWARLQAKPVDGQAEIIAEQSVSGVPTVALVSGGRSLYLHSKYDPVQEAERLVGQFTDLERYKQVFVFGVGMGYHIEALAKKAPHLEFALYEPRLELIRLCMAQRDFADWPLKRITKFLVGNAADEDTIIAEFVGALQGETLFLTLPSYERAFNEEYKRFSEQLRQGLTNKRFNLQASRAFEKRWILNSVANFKYVRETPNIILDKKHLFAGHPALLVSAGPSLNEEIDNLRRIKENGLAYIFAAGSALNALIKNGIEPDIVCSYDPGEPSYKVYADVIASGQDTFPLVFGSSIAHEILENFKGPKLHMIMNRDKFSMSCLRSKTGEEVPALNDASSIAFVTLELLSILGCHPIYLVGQNLAYKNNQRYAGGINYSDAPTDLKAKEIDDAIPVLDVHGETIYTNPLFNKMRIELEMLIEFRKIPVFNTTNGGARIKGADFIPLSKALFEDLKERVVSSKDELIAGGNSYDQEYLNQQISAISKSYQSYKKCLERVLTSFDHLRKLVKYQNEGGTQRELAKLGAELNKLDPNIFHRTFIEPMEIVQSELVNKKMAAIGPEVPVLERGERILKDSIYFFHACEADRQALEPYVKEMFQ